MPGDAMAEYLSGRKLYGDDFGPQQIARWYEQEEEGYADLGAVDRDGYRYSYHALNARHGFSHLPEGRFEHVLGFGSAWGDELLPVAGRAGRITIVEASHRLRASEVGGVPVRQVAPRPSGDVDLPDGEVDLVVCLGVLHHIPNVSHVLRELARVCKPGGHLLLREPIVSMGDWTRPRPGLTRNERGIPLKLLEQALVRAGWRTVRRRLVDFAPLSALTARLAGISPFESGPLTLLDEVLCALTGWNYRYHADSVLARFRPTSAFVVASRA